MGLVDYNYTDRKGQSEAHPGGIALTQFSAPWLHLSVISVLDILLVAIVIYEFLALVRGTRAAVMLVGVAALVLAFYFSRVGELTTLNWLISTLLPYAVFALIVAKLLSSVLISMISLGLTKKDGILTRRPLTDT